MGLYLYTAAIFFHVEWCNRQLWCSSVTLCNITIIAHDYYTDIHPFKTYWYLTSNLLQLGHSFLTDTGK